MNTIPLRVIIGPLGAGKTTLLRQLLSYRAQDGVHGVLVNDFGQTAIDQNRLDEGKNLLIVALQGGCVCCSLQASIQQALLSLINDGATQLWLEPSGIADIRSLYLVLRKLPFIELLPMIAVLPARTLLVERYSPILRSQLALAQYILVSHAHGLDETQQQKINTVFASLYPAKLAWTLAMTDDILKDWVVGLRMVLPTNQQKVTVINPITREVEHLTQPILLPENGTQHGLLQQGLVFPELWQWSRPCLMKSFSSQSMCSIKRIKGMLRTGPQHWYQVDWTPYGNWQWQESLYAGNSRLEVVYRDQTIDWSALMETCRHDR